MKLFVAANCQSCHGGAAIDDQPRPLHAPARREPISNGQLIAELRDVGTFNAQTANEVRQNGRRRSARTASCPFAAVDPCVPADVLAWRSGGFTRRGAAERRASAPPGLPEDDPLQSAARRAQLIKFLLSIDASLHAADCAGRGDAVAVTSAAWDIGAHGPRQPGIGLRVEAGGAGRMATTTRSLSFSGGTTVWCRTRRVLRLAPSSYAGPDQVNFLAARATGNGEAQVTVMSRSGATATASVDIAAVGLDFPDARQLGGRGGRDPCRGRRSADHTQCVSVLRRGHLLGDAHRPRRQYGHDSRRVLRDGLRCPAMCARRSGAWTLPCCSPARKASSSGWTRSMSSSPSLCGGAEGPWSLGSMGS